MKQETRKEFIVYVKENHYEFRNKKGYLEFSISREVPIEKLKQMYLIKAVI